MTWRISGQLAFLLIAVFLMSCRQASSTLPDFTELVEANASAVVNVSTLHKTTEKPAIPQQIPEIFRDFFGNGMPDRMPRDAESQGSGFVIDGDGYILTNYHVIADADQVLVRFKDRRELEADVVGFDERSDLALLKVDGKNLPVVRIGSSEQLRVGEWVLAIGAPFGFESTVTAGIVSAKGRSLPRENYVPFIQTDVAINPGNSGGPLLNLEGEVVGINSQILSRSGGFMGLSFAIPIDMAMDVVDQLREKGTVSRGWLGVVIQDVSRDLAESFGLDRPAGALVAQVLEDSPAEKAGFEVGDVVIRFDGEVIETSSMLPHVVGSMAPGTQARVDVVRDGKPRELQVKVGELPDSVGRESPATPGKTDDSRLGIRVSSLNAQEQEQLGHGVRVVSVEAGPAQKAGIRQGDVIQSLNNQQVNSPAGFEAIVAELPAGKRVPVLVNRGGNPRFLAILLEE